MNEGNKLEENFMYCQNCGKEINEGSICPSCGVKQSEEKRKSKKWPLVIIIVVIFIIAVMVGLFIGKSKNKSEKYNENMEAAYCMLADSADLLDKIADSTYDGWHNAIYESGLDISLGVALAQALVSDEISDVKRIDEALSDLYRNIKSDENRNDDQYRFDAFEECYDSFQEYYEFVINVSGSFETYSDNKESIKKSYRKTVNNFEKEFEHTPDYDYEDMLPEEEDDDSSSEDDEAI